MLCFFLLDANKTEPVSEQPNPELKILESKQS